MSARLFLDEISVGIVDGVKQIALPGVGLTAPGEGPHRTKPLMTPCSHRPAERDHLSPGDLRAATSVFPAFRLRLDRRLSLGLKPEAFGLALTPALQLAGPWESQPHDHHKGKFRIINLSPHTLPTGSVFL